MNKKLSDTTKEHFSNITQELILFLEWIFKNKLLFFSSLVAIFSMFILGNILVIINIPSNSIDTNFFTNIPIILNYAFIKSFFTTQFFFTIASILIFFIMLITVYWKFYSTHKKSIITAISIAIALLSLSTFNRLSDTELPIQAYIETTGYPKIVQSENRYYALLGNDNMAYDLNKGLTAERCTTLKSINYNEISMFYYMLIKKIDYITFPSTAIHLDGNITYLDYNESREWVNKQCEFTLEK